MEVFNDARRIRSGSWSELWINGTKVAECFRHQAKRTYTKEDIHLPGQLETDTKITSSKGTGSISLYNVSDDLSREITESRSAGKDPRFTIVDKEADPDSPNHRRTAYTGVSFDEAVIADWEAGKVSPREYPYTYVKEEYIA